MFQVTSPSIEESRCQAVLLNAIDRLSNRARGLKDCLKHLSPQHQQARDGINRDIADIQSILDKLQDTVQKDKGTHKYNIFYSTNIFKRRFGELYYSFFYN